MTSTSGAQAATTDSEVSFDTFERLYEERLDLATRGRVEIARKIEAARLMGDLKENGDYHAAKEEQGKMEGRIAYLASQLDGCLVRLAEADHVAFTKELEAVESDGDEARAEFLGLLLRHAVPVDPAVLAEGADTVRAGAVVELRYEGEDGTETYLYGSVHEQHDDHEVLSSASPLGQALAGATVGQTVQFEVANGSLLSVEVVSVTA